MLLVKLKSKQGDVRIVSDQVTSFKYKDRERKADLCTMTVKNQDLSQFDDPVWRKGTELSVQWGYPAAMTPAREVIITSVKGFSLLTIEAQAKSVLMNRTKKCRVFENMTITGIAQKLAKENGFTTETIHVDDLDEVIQVVSQARLTDAQFLRRWASKLGFEFFVDFDGFHFHERRIGDAPIRVIRYHTDQRGGDIIGEPTIDNDLTGRPGRVKVKGRDPRTKKDIDESADNDSDSDRDVLAPILEIHFDAEKGPTLVKQKPEEKIGGNDTVLTGEDTSGKAKRRARSRFRRAQQVAVKMTFPMIGDPLLVAKSVVKIEGMGQRLSIRYYLTEVEHDLSPGGYICRPRLISDGHGGHATDSKIAATDFNRVAGQAGKGAGADRKKVNEAIFNALKDGLNAAIQLNDLATAETFKKAAEVYLKNGNKARAEVARFMQQIFQGAKSGTIDFRLAQQAGKIVSALAQSGPETEAGGRLNDNPIIKDDLNLVETLVFDPEGGQRTIYSQARRPTQNRKAGK